MTTRGVPCVPMGILHGQRFETDRLRHKWFCGQACLQVWTRRFDSPRSRIHRRNAPIRPSRIQGQGAQHCRMLRGQIPASRARPAGGHARVEGTVSSGRNAVESRNAALRTGDSNACRSLVCHASRRSSFRPMSGSISPHSRACARSHNSLHV